MAARKKIGSSGASIGVIDARYSSHNQRDASIEQQIDAAKAYAAECGIEIIDTYADRAVSGRSDRRPEFQRMLKDAQKGCFGFVIAWKSNRMGRNMMQSMVNEAILAECGVKCLYTEEDFDDSAAGRFALRSMMNVDQFYSENLAEDIKRGMEYNASQCMVTGAVPFGYTIGKDKRLEIDEPRAEIVREIFRRYVSGDAAIDIARDLNARGLKTQRGGDWNKGSFHRMLHNERYTGVYIFQDLRVEGGIPQIVDKELFERVQEKMNEKKTLKNPARRSSADYLLTGKLFCGLCGAHMIGLSGTSKTKKVSHYYVCADKRRKRTCQKKNVRRDVLERTVAQAIRDYVLTDDVIEWIADQTLAYNDKRLDHSTIDMLRAQLADNKRAISNLMKAIEMGIITDTTKSRLIELEKEQCKINIAIKNEESAIVQISREDLIAGLSAFKDGDIDDKDYLSALFDTFLISVHVFDDKLKITFSFTKDSNSMEIPLVDAQSGDNKSGGLGFDYAPQTSTSGALVEPATIIMVGEVFVLTIPFAK